MKLGQWLARMGLFITFVAASVAACQGTTKVKEPTVHVVTSDVALFWHAWDVWQGREHGDPKQLAPVLQVEYLDKGSDGVHGFIPQRIVSAQNLAAEILKDVAYYREEHAIADQLVASAAKLQQPIAGLLAIDPQAKVPAIYFVIGARNSGGTVTDKGLILGAEMFSPRVNARLHPEDVLAVAVHELIHFQQENKGQNLLAQAMREGAADFFAERLVGHDADEDLKAFGDSREEGIWKLFNAAREGTDIGGWLYNGDSMRFTGDGTPPDLGYYVGYKICQAFYESQTDKPAALKTLLALRDPEAILAQSHYAERFH
jgi:hypothetical protein